MLLLCVQGLSVMELVFFIATCMMVCFVFVARTALITHWSLGCSWALLAQHWHFLFFPLHAYSVRKPGWVRIWERAQKRKSWSDPQGFSSSVHFVTVSWEREGSEQLSECLDANCVNLLLFKTVVSLCTNNSTVLFV